MRKQIRKSDIYNNYVFDQTPQVEGLGNLFTKYFDEDDEFYVQITFTNHITIERTADRNHLGDIVNEVNQYLKELQTNGGK